MGKREEETTIAWNYWSSEKFKDYPALIASIVATIFFVYTLVAQSSAIIGVLTLTVCIFSFKFFKDKKFRERIIGLYPYLCALALITLFADTITTHIGLSIEGNYETNKLLVFLWKKFGYALGFFLHDLINMLLISIYTFCLTRVKNKFVKLVSLSLLSGMILISTFGAINNLYIISITK